MRVDGLDGDTLSFDNMNKRPIKGTKSWTRYEIVLDVPERTLQIAYGALIHGPGRMWFQQPKFEVVDSSVPETSKGRERPALRAPVGFN